MEQDLYFDFYDSFFSQEKNNKNNDIWIANRKNFFFNKSVAYFKGKITDNYFYFYLLNKRIITNFILKNHSDKLTNLSFDVLLWDMTKNLKKLLKLIEIPKISPILHLNLPQKIFDINFLKNNPQDYLGFLYKEIVKNKSLFLATQFYVSKSLASFALSDLENVIKRDYNLHFLILEELSGIPVHIWFWVFFIYLKNKKKWQREYLQLFEKISQKLIFNKKKIKRKIQSNVDLYLINLYEMSELFRKEKFYFDLKKNLFSPTFFSIEERLIYDKYDLKNFLLKHLLGEVVKLVKRDSKYFHILGKLPKLSDIPQLKEEELYNIFSLFFSDEKELIKLKKYQIKNYVTISSNYEFYFKTNLYKAEINYIFNFLLKE